MGIPDRIKEIRKALSQQDFAKKIGAGQRSIHAWESGEALPGSKYLQAIKREFNISTDWLLTGEGEPYINKDRGGEILGGFVLPADQGFKVTEALLMASRVLESGTSYALALLTNIQHFDRAIQAEARITELERKNKDQADRIGKLEAECEELRKRLATLEDALKLAIPQANPEEAAA